MHSIRDANLYTLLVRPRPTNPTHGFRLTDLLEPSYGPDGSSSEPRRRYYLVRSGSSATSSPNATMYRLELRDAYSDLLLASVEAPFRDRQQSPSSTPTPPGKPQSMSLIDRERDAALAAITAPVVQDEDGALKKRAKERKEDDGKPWWKHRRRDLRLYEPEVALKFEDSGGLTFEWFFAYEDFRFRWRREAFSGGDYICSIDRRPDPSIEVCVARQATKGKDAMIQLMDYNLERFRIKDLKGLEIALYISIASIFDATEDRSNRNDSSAATMAVEMGGTVSTQKASSSAPSKSESLAAPKPSSSSRASSTITADDFEDANPNEVFVSSDGKIDTYVSKCVSLLSDSSILFIIIRATGDAALAKAMDVAEMAKKKTRQSKDEPLRQYVIDDSATSSPQLPGSWGRSRTGSTPEPPTKRISIYLSKIDLPDLQRRPQTDVGGKSSSERSSNILSKTSKNGNAQAPPRPPPRPTSGASNGSGKSSHSNSASSMPGSFPGSTDDASGDGSKSGGRWGKFLSPKWRQSS